MRRAGRAAGPAQNTATHKQAAARRLLRDGTRRKERTGRGGALQHPGACAQPTPRLPTRLRASAAKMAALSGPAPWRRGECGARAGTALLSAARLPSLLLLSASLSPQAGCPPCSSSGAPLRRSPGTGRPCTSSARS